jgi:hypothetical protein
MEYYRQVKIAGEDVVEEPPTDAAAVIPGYDGESRLAVRRWVARRYGRGAFGGVTDLVTSWLSDLQKERIGDPLLTVLS